MSANYADRKYRKQYRKTMIKINKQSGISDTCGWISTAGGWPVYPGLSGKQHTDWVIIGAGFTGLAAARRLAELAPEQRILLIDGKHPGQGASARNSGFVVAHESPGHAQLHTQTGRESYLARNAIDRAGVAELATLIKEHNIDCQWDKTGSIHAASDPRNFEVLHKHHQAFSELGIEATLLEANQLSRRLGTQHYKLGVYCEGGALVQPAMLIKGLLENLPEQIEIYQQTPVISIQQAPDSKLLIELPDGEIRARGVILGINAFMPGLGFQKNRMFPLALTASLTRCLNAQEETELNHAKSWGVLAPKSLGATVRLTTDRRLLIRNTAEYLPRGINPGMLAARRKIHLEGLKRRFPWLRDDTIDSTWSGQIGISANSRPVFGEIQKNVYSAGCYNASGVAKGTVMGRLIVDHALNNPSGLLDAARGIATPSWIPGPAIFSPLVKVRMAYERAKGKSES